MNVYEKNTREHHVTACKTLPPISPYLPSPPLYLPPSLLSPPPYLTPSPVYAPPPYMLGLPAEFHHQIITDLSDTLKQTVTIYLSNKEGIEPGAADLDTYDEALLGFLRLDQLRYDMEASRDDLIMHYVRQVQSTGIEDSTNASVVSTNMLDKNSHDSFEGRLEGDPSYTSFSIDMAYTSSSSKRRGSTFGATSPMLDSATRSSLERGSPKQQYPASPGRYK